MAIKLRYAGLFLTSLASCYGATMHLLDENEISAKKVEFITQADQTNATMQPSKQKVSAFMDDHRIQIGANYTYCWITPEENSTLDGSLGGAQGIYEYRPIGSVYTGVAFSYKGGKTTNSVGSRSLQDFNPQMRIGYTCPTWKYADRFTLFTGVGARYMAETVTVGSISVDFDYTTFYIPLGFLYEQKIVNHFSIGCNFQWMPQVFPTVKISPLGGTRWDLTYQLANFLIEIPFIISTDDDRFFVSINPFFESWRDGKSTAVTLTNLALNLPGNKYLFTGVNVNFGYCF